MSIPIHITSYIITHARTGHDPLQNTTRSLENRHISSDHSRLYVTFLTIVRTSSTSHITFYHTQTGQGNPLPHIIPHYPLMHPTHISRHISHCNPIIPFTASTCARIIHFPYEMHHFLLTHPTPVSHHTPSCNAIVSS